MGYLVVVVLVGFTLVACGDSGTEEPTAPDQSREGTPDVAPDPPAPHPAQTLMAANCTGCHGLDKIEAAEKNRDEWVAQIAMCDGEGKLDEAQAAMLAVFLSRTHDR